MSVVGNKIRIYDLAKELKQDTKRIIEELRREGEDVSVPSNIVSEEMAEKIRNRYFPKTHKAPSRSIKLIKKEKSASVEKNAPVSVETAPVMEQKHTVEAKEERKHSSILAAEEAKPETNAFRTVNVAKKPTVAAPDLIEETLNSKIGEEKQTQREIAKRVLAENSSNQATKSSIEKSVTLIKILCSNCLVKTKHEVLYAVQNPEPEFSGRYFVLHCFNCDVISLRKTRLSEQLNSTEYEEKELLESKQLYPFENKGRQKLEHKSIPSKVAKIYEETHIALSNNLLVLSGIGIRALIEAVCDEKNAEGKNLKDKIDDLVDKKLLTQKNAENLQKLRIIGNASAHKVSGQSEKILNVAMDIIEHLLKGEYLLEPLDDNAN